ncbi:MAG: Dabb family protein [Pseudomonadota bacterium]
MIKHIVFWRLKENAHGNDKATNARLIKEKLEALQGKIPGLLKIEVGFDFLHTDTSSYIALYSEMESRAALDAYQVHPLHQALGGFIKEAYVERRSVDYEVADPG